MDFFNTLKQKNLVTRYILGCHRFNLFFGANEQIQIWVEYRQQAPKKNAKYLLSTVFPIIGIVLAILFSMAHESFAALVTIIFGMIAIVRGFQMLGWGLGALTRGEKPVYLSAARPWRLMACSVSLIAITVFLVGLSLVFHGSLVKAYKYTDMEAALKEFVIHQITYAHKKRVETGQSRFDEAAQDVYLKNYPHTRVEYSPDGNHFTVVIPPEDVPFFPYNHMTAVPSYRADETGQIRMIRAKRKGQLCPADAPVIMKIDVKDLRVKMPSSL